MNEDFYFKLCGEEFNYYAKLKLVRVKTKFVENHEMFLCTMSLIQKHFLSSKVVVAVKNDFYLKQNIN